MDPARNGVSTALAAGVLIVILVAAGGAYFAYFSFSAGAAPKTSSSSSSQTSSQSSSSQGSARVILQLQPGTPLVASDVVANYTLNVSVIGSLVAPLDLSYTGPAGLTIVFSPSEVPGGSGSTHVAASFKTADSLPSGMVSFTVNATSGGEKFTQGFHVEVVRFLVVTVGTSFLPANITVPVGSTVYWIRLNGAIDQYDNGDHNVAIPSIGVTSPTLSQYMSWSYTFSQSGAFTYDCTFHAGMNGEVVVH